MSTAPPPLPVSTPTRRLSRFLAGPTMKVVLIGILLLVMLIPMALVGGVIQDREQYQSQALAGFRAGWGPGQSVLGPVLVVPYLTGWGQQEQKEYLHIAASKLSIAASLQPEIRKRGLFHAIVFGATAEIKGQIQVPDDAFPAESNVRPLWQEAYVVLGASDLRALKPDAALIWDGKKLPLGDAAAKDESSCRNLFLLAAHPGLSAAPASGQAIPFEITLDLRGTEAFRIVPIGRQIDVAVSAPWDTPSFSAQMPPADYALDERGFQANWHINSNVATGRWVWASTTAPDCSNGSSVALDTDGQIGVELLESVPTYQMVERASKYGVLFLVLSFLTYFLFEMIARLSIHIVQYGLLGLSIALFALLLISFAEPLGFSPAYGLASLAVMAQASLFTWSVTRRGRLALLFALVLAGLFAFLYVVLSLENFALLAGTVALFAILSVVMVVTRRIDWSRGRLIASEGLTAEGVRP